MKTVLLLVARSGSKRLPEKHFAPLSRDFRAIDILCGRLKRAFPAADFSICIATTTDPADAVFEKNAPAGVSVFRGSTENIPLRQLEAARASGADRVVSIDGDDVLTAPEAIAEILKAYDRTEGAERHLFFSSGLPLGMNASLYSREYLENALRGKERLKLETGWGRVFPRANRVEVAVPSIPYDETKLRFTLDYPEDLRFFSDIAAHFGDSVLVIGTDAIIDYVVRNKVHELNESVIAKYWENFRTEKSREENVVE